jgi:hypothetical protein
VNHQVGTRFECAPDAPRFTHVADEEAELVTRGGRRERAAHLELLQFVAAEDDDAGAALEQRACARVAEGTGAAGDENGWLVLHRHSRGAQETSV